jgi:hypothetical protein
VKKTVDPNRRTSNGKAKRGATRSNVIPLAGARRKAPPGKLDVAALARVVGPLPPAQREAGIAARANLDQMAVTAWLYEPFTTRRAGETDEAYALRVRCHAALGFVRRAWLDLEALRPTWEGGPSVHLPELRRMLRAIELAQNSVEGEGRSDVRLRAIGAVREALEWSRRAKEKAGEALDGDDLVAPMPDVDAVRDYACVREPALSVVSIAAWREATERWPGLQTTRGGPRSKGARTAETWQAVVHDLLRSAGLTGAKKARALLSLWDKAKKK